MAGQSPFPNTPIPTRRRNTLGIVLPLGIATFLALTQLTGCPLLGTGPVTFTSADLGGGGGFFGDVAEGAGNEAPTGDGRAEERQVIEPDIIRRDGHHLFVLNQFRGLTIVDLNSDTLLARVPTIGFPRDLYLEGDTAYVLVDGLPAALSDGTVQDRRATRLYTIDLTQPEEAAIIHTQDLAGALVDSRMVGAHLYTVTTEFEGYDDFGGAEIAHYSPTGTTTVTSLDLTTTPTVSDAVDFPGSGHVIHATNEAIFVATSDWASQHTTVVYLDITQSNGTIRNGGTMAVQGHIADRFKLDAWNGTLRVVSATWSSERQVLISTFDLTDPTLPQLAARSIPGAEGETLFATRFDGARAYVVTYLIVDPLFVLDLADPTDPVVLGALEVPGYSTHIETRGDRLITLGVDDTDGRQVNVSIFDVSGNGTPALLDRVRFGENWSWSSAYDDVKALTILDDVIIVPFSGWNDRQGGFDRLQFVSYTRDTLSLRGAVDLQGHILRSFDYETAYYGVTTEQLSRIDASDLDAPEIESTLTLAENLVDYLPIHEDLGIEIVAQQDGGHLLLRTVSSTGEERAHVELDSGYYQGAWHLGDTVLTLGVVWNGVAGYVVNQVDISDPDAPEAGERVVIPVDPYYAYYGFDIYARGGFPEDGVASADIAGFPYYYGTSEPIAFLTPTHLAMRCFADEFDRTIGPDTPYQGLALFDTESGTWTETVGLGYDRIVSLDARDGFLYLGTRDPVGIPALTPMTAYYIQPLDLATRVEGPRVNVPGAFLDYDPEGDILTLLDHQWLPGGAVQSTLETVRWNGDDAVSLVERLVLPEHAYNHHVTNRRVYFEHYDRGTTLYQVTVSESGALDLSAPYPYTSNYGYLIGAIDDHALISHQYGLLQLLRFENGTPEVVQDLPIMGYPSTLRASEHTLYLPLGYHGLVAVPRE